VIWAWLALVLGALAGIGWGVLDLVTDPPAGGWRMVWRRY